MKTVIASASAIGRNAKTDRTLAERILSECRAGKRDRQSKAVLSAVATLGVAKAVEIFTGEPLNSPTNAAKAKRVAYGRRLVRRLDAAQAGVH